MNQEEINDLLALTALTAIAPEELQSIEELAAASPEIEQELRSLQNVAATLAYSQPSLTVPVSLKQRLFNRIQIEAEVLDIMTNRLTELNWQKHPVPGLVMAVLDIDRDQKKYLL